MQKNNIDIKDELGFFAQLFIDSGEGFSEEGSLKIELAGFEEVLEFDLSNHTDIQFFRYDPINTQCLIQIDGFDLYDKDDNLVELKFETNANWQEGSIFLFETYDPSIFFMLVNKEKQFSKLHVKFSFISIGSRIQFYKEKIQELNSVLVTKVGLENKLAEMSSEVSEYSPKDVTLLDEIKYQLNERIAQYQSLKEEFKKENTSLLIERENLLTKLKSEESKTSKISIDNQKLSNLLKKLETKVSELTKVRDNSEKSKEVIERKYQKELDKLSIKLELLSKQEKEIKNTLESTSKSILEKSSKLELSRHEISSLTEEKANLKTEISNQLSYIEELKSQITEQTLECNTLQYNIDLSMKRIEEKELEIKEYEQSIKSLQQTIDELNKQVHDKEVHIQNIEGFNQDYANTIQALESAKQEHAKIIANLANAKANLETHVSKLNKYVDDIESSMSYKVGFGLTSPARSIMSAISGSGATKAQRPILKEIQHDNLEGIKIVFGDEDETIVDDDIQIGKPKASNLEDDDLIIQVDDSKFIDNETIIINGWILSQKNEGIEHIELWEKEHILGNVEYGLERSDVGNKYPSLKNSTTSGFSFYHKIFSKENFVELRIKKDNGDIIKKSVAINYQKASATDTTSSNPLLSLIKKNSNKSNEYYQPLSEKHWKSNGKDIKTIAYYLPQFHTFKENDEWWGKGFTEWTNVTQAIPRFEDHLQPRLPGELGFYDLTKIEVMKRQVELAQQYGLHGFCFHFYWFSGKRVLETPVNNWLDNPDIDFPFCINWANENWTRRWDGADHDILLKQNYSEQDATDFYLEAIKVFEDKRYITIDDRPVLLVYRPTHIPEVKKWTDTWRKIAKDKKLKNPYLIACGSFEYVDPSSIGFDASVEFPPHQIWQRYPGVEFEEMDITHKAVNPEYAEIDLFDQEFNGRIYDFRTLSRASFREPELEKPWFRCVMPSWDNEARKKGSGHAFHHASPYFFRNWMRNACATAKKNKQSEQFVFINAWNEWAEGAFLEPDRYYGYSYLQALAETLSEFSAEPANKTNFPPFNLKQNNKVAVVLHLYYTDLFQYFAEQLDQIPESFDLYISITTENAAFKEEILAKYPNAQVFVMENRGRDVGPFMEIMTRINHLSYDAILKIHSKKSQYIEDGNEWRDYLIDNLLGDKKHIKTILDKFRSDKSLGLVAPTKCWLPLKGWYIKDNMPQLYRLGNLLDTQHLIAPLDKDLEEKSIKGKAPIAEDINLEEPHFPGGTMFWFRKEAMHGLFNLALTQADFPEEGGQLDATVAHAIERIVGLLPKEGNFTIQAIERSTTNSPKNTKKSKTKKAAKV